MEQEQAEKNRINEEITLWVWSKARITESNLVLVNGVLDQDAIYMPNFCDDLNALFKYAVPNLTNDNFGVEMEATQGGSRVRIRGMVTWHVFSEKMNKTPSLALALAIEKLIKK